MTSADLSTSSIAGPAGRSDPGYQAFLLLRTVFTVAPILFGLDKFANLLVRWPGYLAPGIDDNVPGTAQHAASERVIPTAILSNLGLLDEDLEFGPELRAGEVWFSPPARMPMGLAVGAVTAVGRLHRVFRCRHPLFGPAEIAGFADSYLAELGHLTACARVGSLR